MTIWRHWMVGQLDASIAAALLLAIAVLMRHRLSPSVRSIILLIALVRMAVPPWLRSPWSEALVDIPPIADGRMLAAAGLQSDAAMTAATITTAVSLALLSRIAWTFLTAERRWVVATTPAPTPMIDGVEVRLSNNEGPLAVGIRRKLIVLPASALQLDRDAFDAVIAHELAHHRRHDLWWIAAAEVLKAIAWFNPLAHVVARALVSSREDGSDDWAVRQTSNDPFAYAHALLQSARLVAPPQPLGAAGAHPMGKRLQRLLDSGASRDGRIGVAGALALIFVIGAAVPGAHMPSSRDGDNGERIVIVIRR
jgi:beta-lactamase regulating signal transducer with metallopeptidase domain